MLPCEEKITSDIKEAMRAKDQVRLNVLRAMKSALKYKLVEKKQEDLTEQEAIAVFQTLIKQRKEAFDQFEKYDRKEQADKERKEIEVLMGFLPEQMGEDEIKKLVQDAVSVSGAESAKDMGKVMKELKPKVAGRADNKLVADLVKQALST